MRTGRHKFLLPPAYGRPTHPSVEGVCQGCGLVRRYPTSHRRAVNRKKYREQRPQDHLLGIAELPPVAEASTTKAQVTFDSLCHVGNGTPGALGRVIAHDDNSALAQWNYLRKLQSLGHADLSRSRLNLEVEHWEVSPSTLLAIGPGQYVLIGRRSAPELNELEEAVAVLGGTVSSFDDQGIPRVIVSVADVDDLITRAAQFWDELAISRNAAARLVAALPRLSEVVSALPRFGIASTSDLEVWDNESASWQASDSPRTVGAFRMGGFSRTYFVRDERDLSDGTARHATPELAKHVAAMWCNDPLYGYHADTGSLLVPTGAELPGLYGRAACLASGRLPRPLTKAPAVQYHSVDAALAGALHSKLSG